MARRNARLNNSQVGKKGIWIAKDGRRSTLARAGGKRMKPRGRISAEALSMIDVGGEQPRLSPPPSLSEPEREMFDVVVAGCDADHFRQTDLPLLARFC